MPHDPPNPHQHAVRDALRSAYDLVSVARALVGTGRAVELSGLDAQVARLCAAAVALPAEDGRALRAEFCALLQHLDGLGVRLATA